MSRTLHFGRDILDAPDINLEELLSLMSPKDIQSLVDEMAADPGKDSNFVVSYSSRGKAFSGYFKTFSKNKFHPNLGNSFLLNS